MPALGIRVDTQVLADLGGLSGQVSSIGQVLDVLEPDPLGQEEAGDGRQDGDDGGGEDLLEHDLFVGADESLPDGRAKGLLQV